jgi:hypothetical protein
VAAKWWYFLKSAGGELFEECTPKSGKYRAGYDNAAGRDTLKLYIDSLYKHKIHEPKLKQDAEGFANQQAAMFVRESWLVGYMKKNAPAVQTPWHHCRPGRRRTPCCSTNLTSPAGPSNRRRPGISSCSWRTVPS